MLTFRVYDARSEQRTDLQIVVTLQHTWADIRHIIAAHVYAHTHTFSDYGVSVPVIAVSTGSKVLTLSVPSVFSWVCLTPRAWC